jgi:hypothetical protein
MSRTDAADGALGGPANSPTCLAHRRCMAHEGLRTRRLWLAAVAVLTIPLSALAAPPQAAKTRDEAANATETSLRSLSQYERDVLTTVLKERHVALETQPFDKSVESLEVETLDVFEPADPLPGWLNWFHTTSRTAVIEREILVRPGQPYDQRLVDESARNLRNLKQLSLVLVVPVKAETPGRVRLLVITKDVWSLRLNSSFRVRNSTLEYLTLQPSEENFAGTHLVVAGQYMYDLSTNTFGAGISHQRIFGSRILAALSINAIQYRKTGAIEGSSGSFRFGQPLYSTRTKWGWGTSLAWVNQMNRPMLPDSSGTYVPRRYRDPSNPNGSVPYEYHSRILSWQTAVSRSYGYNQKTNLSIGLEANQRNFDANTLRAQGYAADIVARFEHNALERKNVRLGPFAMLETYRNKFVTVFDFETLGLQEDLQLGPRAFVKIYSGTKRALGTRDLVGITTSVQYSMSLAGSFARFWATHATEVTPRHEDNDGLIQGGIRLVSPPLGIGRLVYDGGALYHFQNSRNFRYALGGDTRLRGYPSEQFLGQHLVASNLEFRSRSVRIMEVLFALVGFYDVGDAFDSPSRLHPKHSVGFGGRAAFPQFQRAVGRLDVAFPLTAPSTGTMERWNDVTVFLTLEGQAFPMPVVQTSTSRTPLLAPPD